MSDARNETWTDADQADLVTRAQFRLVVTGRETAWVRSVSGTEPDTAQVAISLDQLTLQGPLRAVRERVAALLELLDRVAAQPERWPDLKLTRVAETRWRRTKPHPSHAATATNRRVISEGPPQHQVRASQTPVHVVLRARRDRRASEFSAGHAAE